MRLAERDTVLLALGATTRAGSGDSPTSERACRFPLKAFVTGAQVYGVKNIILSNYAYGSGAHDDGDSDGFSHNYILPPRPRLCQAVDGRDKWSREPGKQGKEYAPAYPPPPQHNLHLTPPM